MYLKDTMAEPAAAIKIYRCFGEVRYVGICFSQEGRCVLPEPLSFVR
jgi:hypothetical protein